ncbi:MAG: hypothetical protein AB4372_25265, partial [Xenococcus sp. (in: cyanobacteria)]
RICFAATIFISCLGARSLARETRAGSHRKFFEDKATEHPLGARSLGRACPRMGRTRPGSHRF